jgi:hypothetical protein
VGAPNPAVQIAPPPSPAVFFLNLLFEIVATPSIRIAPPQTEIPAWLF